MPLCHSMLLAASLMETSVVFILLLTYSLRNLTALGVRFSRGAFIIRLRLRS
jgi:hypothetical protein